MSRERSVVNKYLTKAAPSVKEKTAMGKRAYSDKRWDGARYRDPHEGVDTTRILCKVILNETAL